MTDITRQLDPLVRAYGVRRAAHDIGVSQTLLSLWLAGERSLRPDRMIALLDVLSDRLDSDRQTIRKVRRRMKR